MPVVIDLSNDLPLRYTLVEELSFAGQSVGAVWTALVAMGEGIHRNRETMEDLLFEWNSKNTKKINMRGYFQGHTYHQFMEYIERKANDYAGLLVQERREAKSSQIHALMEARNAIQEQINKAQGV